MGKIAEATVGPRDQFSLSGLLSHLSLQQSRVIGQWLEQKGPLLHWTIYGSPSLCLGAADRDFIDSDRGQSDADGYGLPFFTAGPYAFVQLQIMANHGDLR